MATGAHEHRATGKSSGRGAQKNRGTGAQSHTGTGPQSTGLQRNGSTVAGAQEHMMKTCFCIFYSAQSPLHLSDCGRAGGAEKPLAEHQQQQLHQQQK